MDLTTLKAAAEVPRAPYLGGGGDNEGWDGGWEGGGGGGAGEALPRPAVS